MSASIWAPPSWRPLAAEAKSRFTGRIPKVTIELREANAKADAAVVEGRKVVARLQE